MYRTKIILASTYALILTVYVVINQQGGYSAYDSQFVTSSSGINTNLKDFKHIVEYVYLYKDTTVLHN